MYKTFTRLLPLFLLAFGFSSISAQDYNVTLSIDMNTYCPGYDSVYVAGTFNGWSADANPMDDSDGDGIWTATIALPAGGQEYKFQIDKWADQDQFEGGESCTVTNGGFTNRFVDLVSDTTVATVCLSSCAPCVAPADGMVGLSVNLNGYTLGAIDSVMVRGSFNGWGNPSLYMDDSDGDGIWTVDAPMTGGINEYKFVVNDNWESLDAAEACVLNNNRFLCVDGDASTGTVCYGSCEDCVLAEPGDVTFNVDMNFYTQAFSQVYLAGAFNGWSADANPMDDTDGDGIWTVTIPAMAAGNQEYKFQVDQWADQEMLTEGDPCTVTGGGFTNRFVFVDGNTDAGTYCWGSCNICANDGMVTLSVDMEDFGGADSVFLAGGFNGWDSGANKMDDSDGDGVFTITVSMPAGVNQYKFVANGSVWEEFPDIIDGCTFDDGGGFVNRVLTVDGDATIPSVCFNKCGDCDGVAMIDAALPLKYDNENVTHVLFPFGDANAEIIDNPDPSGENLSAKVLHIDKTAGAQPWAGVAQPIEVMNFANGSVHTILFWSPRAGVDVLFKIEDTNSPPDGNGNPSVIAEVFATNSVANQWELLTFDMADFPAFSVDTSYNQVVLFADMNQAGLGESFYMDCVQNSGDVAVEDVLFGNSKFNVYPNPTTDNVFLNYEMPVAAKINFVIVDALGKVVAKENIGLRTQGTYTENIDVSNLNSGIYFVALEVAGKFVQSKSLIID